MAAMKELKAYTRAKAGKGAARAERRAHRVPAVIYGDKKAPVLISLDFNQINNTIYAGHFLSTVFTLDVDGEKHRVIPRDYQMDVVKDFPIHVDFLRLGEGAEIHVEIPVHLKGTDVAPGVKRGGTVNLVEHSIELVCKAESIPDSIDIDISALNIGASIHLADLKLPAGTRAATKENLTILSIIAPGGGEAAAEG